MLLNGLVSIRRPITLTFLFISGSYLFEIEVNGVRRFYDATLYNGTNIGRFINQDGVLEALLDVRRRSNKNDFTEFRQEEWRDVNKRLEQKANARYVVEGEALVVKAKIDFQVSTTSTEIFASYGSLAGYWVSGIVRDPASYPTPMVDVVRFLYNSDDCNWTRAQKAEWGRCDDLLDQQGKLTTLPDAP